MIRGIAFALCAVLCRLALAADVNVYAASSLTDALKEIAAAYQAKSGDHLSFNFAASNVLARQIEEGAPADIFFSADDAQMERLIKDGKIDPATRRVLLSNELVVVAPSDSSLTLQSAADLRNVERIAVGDPKFVPVGVYARTYLEKIGLWKDLERKVIPTENVRAGLAVVESGNADVGFVYRSDAKISSKVKVILRVPPEEAPAIDYPAALVAAAPARFAAEQFLQHLASNDAGKVFEKFGFIVKKG